MNIAEDRTVVIEMVKRPYSFLQVLGGGGFRERRLYVVGRGPGTASRADGRKPGHSSSAWGLGCRLQPRSGDLPSGTGSEP